MSLAAYDDALALEQYQPAWENASAPRMDV